MNINTNQDKPNTDKPNIKGFFKQSSISEKLFIYTSRGYRFNSGRLSGQYIQDLIVDYYDETLELIEELYNETESINTKFVLKDIIKIHFPEKLKKS